MRTKKVLINTLAAMISHFISFIISIITRRVFLTVFDIQLIGYESLFTSVFTVLSIAEMGSGSMFSYMLFSSLAHDDKEETAVIMGMYRKLYTIIGLLVFGIGLLIYFFLPFLFRDQIHSSSYIKTIYMAQLLTVVLNYHFVYRKAIVIADQKSYKIVRISIIYEITCFIIRLVGLLYFKSYEVYLFAPLLKTILLCFHCNILSGKLYPYAFKKNVSFSDFKERKAFDQIKALLVSRIAIIIYSSTDPIMISAIAGINENGYYSNYNQFNDAAKNMLSYFTESVEKSTGNLIYSESKEKAKHFFSNLDFLGLYIGVIALCVCIGVFQDVIIFVYGSRYLLHASLTITLGIDFYIRCRGISYCCFQTAIGHYEKTTIFAILASVTNVLLSFILGRNWGITGILIGTICGNVFIQAGRARVTLYFLEIKNVIPIIIKEVSYIVIAFCALVVCQYLSSTINLANKVNDFILTVIISTIIPVIMITVFYFRTNRFKEFYKYCLNTIRTIRK